jgi:NDP-sugar pyrophosphorylase family protein
MDALIFAAGLGTRLGPLTAETPKALIEVAGKTLLEHAARRLAAAGVTRLVVNVCHHAEQIARFVAAHDLGLPVVLSPEPGGPFETGGGLKAARNLLGRDGPIVLHNVDVFTDLPLARLVEAHVASGALATLAVMERASTRRLLFDDRGLLGRVDETAGLDRRARPTEGDVVPLAFAGLHVVGPTLLGRITEEGRFSILDTYLRLAGEGERIVPYRMDANAWIDVGRPADLERARVKFMRA